MVGAQFCETNLLVSRRGRWGGASGNALAVSDRDSAGFEDRGKGSRLGADKLVSKSGRDLVGSGGQAAVDHWARVEGRGRRRGG